LYNLVLIDKKNVESALVNAYKINTSTTENFAYDLSYVILNANSDTCQIKSTEQTKELLVYKPAFSVKDIQVQLSDSYGYTKIYYLQAQPSNLISFVQLTEGQVFENDTFVLKTGSETSDADHEIVLSTTQFEDDCLVSYRLLAADGTDLSGIDGGDMSGADGDVSGHDVGNPADAGAMHLFTFQGIITFLCVFAWSAILTYMGTNSILLSLLVGFVLGAGAMFGVAKIIQASAKLAQNGNINAKNYLGELGTGFVGKI